MNADPDEATFAAALPEGVRVRRVEGVNGLSMRLLEAGEADRPALVLLHGFPELAWSWRKVAPALAAAGFYVVAPDQRGYGGTTGWDARFDGDLASFRQFNLTQDILELVFALGPREVAAVVGHDFGSTVAAHCALLRPDVFRRLVMMSAPFAGAPDPQPRFAAVGDIHAELARLSPPRKHYQWYFSSRAAEPDMLAAPQGLQLSCAPTTTPRAPTGLAIGRSGCGWRADELARLPDYYVMPLADTMPEAVARTCRPRKRSPPVVAPGR